MRDVRTQDRLHWGGPAPSQKRSFDRSRRIDLAISREKKVPRAARSIDLIGA